MAESPETRLRELNLHLPGLPAPAGQYVGWRRSGHLLLLAGHVSPGWTGTVGADLDREAGRLAARACALALLVRIREAVGTLDAVAQVLRLGAWVSCVAGYRDVPAVVDGASEVLLDVFGIDRGAHARSAVGVGALPLGAAVEADLALEVRDLMDPGVATWRHRTEDTCPLPERSIR